MLTASTVAELGAQRLTYQNVDRTLGASPPGYSVFSRTRRLPAGTDFGDTRRALMSWQVQARSGLQVAASAPVIKLGAVVVMRFGLGPVAVSIPCRVVDVIDEGDAQGFSYGTLPGHPESGEESFLLERTVEGPVTFTVSAFSRPASRLAKLGGPVTTGVQRLMTGRYLRALG